MEVDEEDMELDIRCLQIKKLKDKVKSLVSEVSNSDEFIYNGKIKHDVNNVLNGSTEDYNFDENQDEFIDFSDSDFADERTWIFDPDDIQRSDPPSILEIFKLVYIDINDINPDIKSLCNQLRTANKPSPFPTSTISNNQKLPIDSRTFTRPKKYTSRPSLNLETKPDDPTKTIKLQRRLTTTILPSPNLIPKLEELSRVNNRPVSGNYGDLNWEDGAQEDLAVNFDNKSKRRSIPASLFERLQELKRSNNPSALAKVLESNGSVLNGKMDDERENLLEDAKKVTAAFDFHASSSRLSEVFKCSNEYFSDDNESFINVDEMSSFCDRLTLSTDQSTYASIVKEMEKHEIYLSHKPAAFDEPEENRLTFGGMEIVKNELNRTYELDNKSSEKLNQTFEVKSESLKNSLNSTYDADNKPPGLVDVILKNFSPNFTGIFNNKNVEGNNYLNNTYEKINETFNKNEINSMHNEKYTTKIFDATFKRQTAAAAVSPPQNNSLSPPKKDSDHSEDDCMSTTSDNSYRSVESNTELKNIEELKSIALEQNKKLIEKKFSTPKCENNRVLTRKSEEWPSFSPIRRDSGNGDAESQTSSNASSRGPSPRMYSTASAEGLAKPRASNVRQSINKVPQRELKLKPALMRPTQNYRRTMNNLKTSSEPSVPQKVESCPNASYMPVPRPAVQPIVPSAMRPPSRTSGIPRPPSKLKPPQIRTTEKK